MDINYLAYKRQNSKIGAVLLIFLGATLVLSFGILFLDLLEPMFGSPVAYKVTYDLVYSALYFCMFFIPMLMYKKFDKSYSFKMMPCKFKLSRSFPMLLIGGIGINFVASYINSIIVSMLGMDLNSLVFNEYASGYSGYNFVLDTIMLAMVPAFVEELLFRGLILERLSRFGRGKAIVISALLFGLMHQHPMQLFYTFILGLILGYMTFESGSVWGAIILHFVNNFTQVIITAVQETQYEQRAMFIIYAIELVIIVAGALCAIFYFKKHAKEKILNDEWMAYPKCNAPEGGLVKGFLTPTMLIYCIICAVSVVASFFII